MARSLGSRVGRRKRVAACAMGLKWGSNSGPPARAMWPTKSATASMSTLSWSSSSSSSPSSARCCATPTPLNRPTTPSSTTGANSPSAGRPAAVTNSPSVSQMRATVSSSASASMRYAITFTTPCSAGASVGGSAAADETPRAGATPVSLIIASPMRIRLVTADRLTSGTGWLHMALHSTSMGDRCGAMAAERCSANAPVACSAALLRSTCDDCTS
mmetsp:Transcript_21155/g.68235  ORF Transcript_21155/g.68235 Transcript_21155/m.68235 type:complete len:216 (-) Transcript_21155:118-765(-)